MTEQPRCPDCGRPEAECQASSGYAKNILECREQTIDTLKDQLAKAERAIEAAKVTCRSAVAFLLAVPQHDSYAREARVLSEDAANLLSAVKRDGE